MQKIKELRFLHIKRKQNVKNSGGDHEDAIIKNFELISDFFDSFISKFRTVF